MIEHGCYCKAGGAIAPGGPASIEKKRWVRVPLVKNCTTCRYSDPEEPETLSRLDSNPTLRRECGECTPMGLPFKYHRYPQWRKK